MNKILSLGCMLCMSGIIQAQAVADPVVMKINGKAVPRSEFEYNYNKNNTDNVVNKTTISEYCDLFIAYKLKVEAALDARYDTLASFKQEFASYRDAQIKPFLMSTSIQERELMNYYQQMKTAIGPDGLVRASHILIMLPQKASALDQQKAKDRADSIYLELKNGNDFAVLAQKYSDDKGSGSRGGELGWLAKGQTIPEFEKELFSLKNGTFSGPVLSSVGYHIILKHEEKQLEPYEELREQILKFLDKRGLKDRVVKLSLDSISKASGGISPEKILEAKCEELCANDANLKYLIQEYHDGLLLFELSQKDIWEKAAADTEGLKKYFKANKKKYRWTEPHFRGCVFHACDEATAQQVRSLLKKVDESQWVDTLRATFNRDSLQQIRLDKNMFVKGDNKYVDYLVFKAKEKPEPLAKFPITDVLGKKLKKPKDWTDVKGEVTSDYQQECEKRYVESLKKRYQVEVYKDQLETVNKH